MHGIRDSIENRLGNETGPNYKSEGERKIAYFMDQNNIGYHYEPAVLIHTDHGKPRIWYPDFYLHEFKTYLEYFGMVGDHSYDKGIRAKQSAYKQAGLDVISIYPWMFRENWQGYIMKELERTTLSRYRSLMVKPYWTSQNVRASIDRVPSAYHRRRSSKY